MRYNIDNDPSNNDKESWGSSNKKKKSVAGLLTNFNLIVLFLLLFFAWIMFFDKNSIRQLNIVKAEISVLEQERDFYLEKIRQDSLVIKNIDNREFLEEYAREEFMMKMAGETMFVVKKDTIN